MPLFEISAEVIGSERRGLWAHYFVIPDRLREVAAWLARCTRRGLCDGASLTRPARARFAARLWGPPSAGGARAALPR
jgi:hypothetical protein